MIYFLDMTDFFNDKKDPPYSQDKWFIVGAVCAFILVGPISDFLLKGKA